MLGTKIQDALNAQINAEQYSAQVYLAMSGYCDGRGFKGFAQWLRVQASEESEHARRLMTYLLDRSGVLDLRPIPAPPATYSGVVDVFEQVLAHEKAVTGKIDALFALARNEKDYASEIALQWYVTEQIEEEATAAQVLEQLSAVGDKGGGVWYLDSKLGKRGSK